MAPHMAKTYAIRKAFSLLKSENYDGIVIESDCWQVVHSLNNSIDDTSEFGLLL